MEAKKAGEEDLSMEEILHSIRKIIAEDGEDAGAGTTATNGGTPAVAGSDVLELTDLVEEPAAATTTPAAPVNDVLSQIDQAVIDEPAPKVVAPAPAETPATPPAPAAPAPKVTSAQDQAYIDSLLSKESANAASAALKKALPPVDGPIPTTPSAPLRSGNTVEDLVMESLKPMLKSWLDANLPTIVERIVEREVRKLSH